MKKLLFCLLLLLSTVDTFAMSEDTKIILEQMDKRFDLMQRNMDKRFEQVDKRFEQVDKRFAIVQHNIDKRFEFMNSILFGIMMMIFASPFIALYLRDKREAEDKKNFDVVKGMLFVLKELAEDNERVAKSLRAASLL